MADEMVKFEDENGGNVITNDSNLIETLSNSGYDLIPVDDDEDEDEENGYSGGIMDAAKGAAIVVVGAGVGYGLYKGAKFLGGKIKDFRIRRAAKLLSKEGFDVINPEFDDDVDEDVEEVVNNEVPETANNDVKETKKKK